MAIKKSHCLFLLKNPIKKIKSCLNNEKFHCFFSWSSTSTFFHPSFCYSETLQNTTQEMTKDEDFKLLKIQGFLSLLNYYFFPYELALWWLQEQSQENPSENWRWFLYLSLQKKKLMQKSPTERIRPHHASDRISALCTASHHITYTDRIRPSDAFFLPHHTHYARLMRAFLNQGYTSIKPKEV